MTLFGPVNLITRQFVMILNVFELSTSSMDSSLLNITNRSHNRQWLKNRQILIIGKAPDYRPMLVITD